MFRSSLCSSSRANVYNVQSGTFPKASTCLGRARTNVKPKKKHVNCFVSDNTSNTSMWWDEEGETLTVIESNRLSNAFSSQSNSICSLVSEQETVVETSTHPVPEIYIDDYSTPSLSPGSNQLHDQPGNISPGSNQLHDQPGNISPGSNHLHDQPGNISPGSNQLHDQPGNISPGSNQLHDQPGNISPGSNQLHDQPGNISPGSTSLAPRSTSYSPRSANHSIGSTNLSPGSTNQSPGPTKLSPGSRSHSLASISHSPGARSHSLGSISHSPGSGNLSIGSIDHSPGPKADNLYPTTINRSVEPPIIDRSSTPSVFSDPVFDVTKRSNTGGTLDITVSEGAPVVSTSHHGRKTHTQGRYSNVPSTLLNGQQYRDDTSLHHGKYLYYRYIKMYNI